MKVYKIAVINLGSTSTKFAYYENDQQKIREDLIHEAADLKQFPSIWDQYDYRLNAVLGCLKKHKIELSSLDAIVTRGGHTEPVVGGVYRVNRKMLDESASGLYGRHASDLGMRIANHISQFGPIPLTVDPPVTDEFEPLARYSGLAELPRRSSFHVLNHRAVGKQYAKDIGKNYEDINLVVAHMGGGITVAAHKKGKLVDANNGIAGDGPFSTNRCCTVPVGGLVEMCFSGKYTHEQMKNKLNGQGGMMSYLGENDVLSVSKRADAGDKKCAEVLDAMAYQTSKEIAGCASVLCGNVEAILLTGGVARCKQITDFIKDHVSFIAPVVLYPGEFEMQALALNTYEALTGRQQIREIK